MTKKKRANVLFANARRSRQLQKKRAPHNKRKWMLILLHSEQVCICVCTQWNRVGILCTWSTDIHNC